MKKYIISAVMIFASVASVYAQNELNYSDDPFQRNKHHITDYLDVAVCNIGNDPVEKEVLELAKHGAYFGITAGVQDFDARFTPMGGAVVGWEGGKKMPLKFEYNGTLTTGHYTREADRTNTYVEFDSRLWAAICLFTSKNKQWRVWVGPYGDYKLSFDHHKNEATNTTIRENEYEVVTTTETRASEIEVKASSLGFGGIAEIGWTPEFSRLSYRLYGGFGRQQRFYDDGNRWHNQWFAGVKLTYNFSVYEFVDNVFLQKTSLSKKDVKKLSKGKKAASNTPAWY